MAIKKFDEFVNEGIKALFERLPKFKDSKIIGIRLHIAEGRFSNAATIIDYANENKDYTLSLSFINEYIVGVHSIFMDLFTANKFIKEKSNNLKLYDKVMKDILSSIPILYEDINKYIEDIKKYEVLCKDTIQARFKDDIENSSQYQKYLLEKGEIKK
jgi:hypothetical protein